ncbi:hypothetical protein [Paracraurococcus ruber]|uniref:Lipoprotein n=1 Tax=Paracraurococcus ruber TaxID=77675 RepID=A0ABS1D2D7_9PROT|nr:hypothetical protein [Paracraurococcus ruber]MBK1660678.1 hypothetical protein [Paracraurococcus ruber]TDG27201.1 hypothetical protein E2C05_23730 [Paracraurococcus ruber]
MAGLAVLLPLLAGGCSGGAPRDPLAAQYFSDPAYGGRRTAFQPRPAAFAPPVIAPGTSRGPGGLF